MIKMRHVINKVILYPLRFEPIYQYQLRGGRRLANLLSTPLPGGDQLKHNGANYAVGRGDVLLLPAMVGACAFIPRSEVTLLEISIPEVTSYNEETNCL